MLLLSILLVGDRAGFASESTPIPAEADPQAVISADDRARLPGLFRDSYLGLSAGLGLFGFTDANLAPSLHSTRVFSDRTSVRIAAGHYVTPRFALQLSLLRPLQWVEYTGVYGPGSSNSVWVTVLALTARPSLPIGDRFSLFGDLGAAYVSRLGFTGPGGGPGLKSAGVVTPQTGGGLLYRLSAHWSLDASAGVTWRSTRVSQPATRYAGLGAAYLFRPAAEAGAAGSAEYDWPLQAFEVGFFDRRLFYWDATKVVSTRSVPLFFNGKIKTRSGYTLLYERNVFHATRWISLDWGVSTGRWASAVRGASFYTVAVFPAILLWPVRTSFIDSYVTYSVAGPAYISRTVIDAKPAGSNFTFQDYIGVGALAGHGKHLTVSVKLMHYSNGNLMAHNPGVAPPLTLNAGYTW